MTQVSGTSSARPVRTPDTASGRGRPEPAPRQVADMKDALRDAGKRLTSLREEKGLKVPLQARKQAEVPIEHRDPKDARELVLHDEKRHEREEGLPGFAAQAQSPTPVAMPMMPALQVDPSAFAQLLAELWTRENGKGAKEVTVRFGARSWPATGARLVRNAAGALDIALELGDRGAVHGGRLDTLAEALQDAGVSLGSLTAELA